MHDNAILGAFAGAFGLLAGIGMLLAKPITWDGIKKRFGLSSTDQRGTS
jgi:hypothetical protein